MQNYTRSNITGKKNQLLYTLALERADVNLFPLSRSDIAWKDAKYAEIWEYLRDEFELTQRFASLDFKLKFVEVCFFQSVLVRETVVNCLNVSVTVTIFFFLQHNIRFLQESLQNRKSDSLEWLIIVLIGTEILISIYDIAQKSVLQESLFLLRPLLFLNFRQQVSFKSEQPRFFLLYQVCCIYLFILGLNYMQYAESNSVVKSLLFLIFPSNL